MPQTPNGAAASYASVTTLLRFYDATLVGGLVNDDGTVATASDLTTPNTPANLVVQQHLDAASGQLEAAALRGQRYATADLSALTGVSAKHRDRIVCAIVVGELLCRRDPTRPPPPLLEWAEWQLKALEDGAEVFALAETEAAGVESLVTRTAGDAQNLNSVVHRASSLFGSHQAT